MTKETPLVNADYRLEKFPDKGGWAYAAIPEIPQDPHTPFGWVKVRGAIDEYVLEQYKLMPMGNGKLFLPVKVAIRRQIRKQAGDYVRIVLYPDDAPLEVPEEIMACFEYEDQQVDETFRTFTEGEQKVYLDWIYGAKTEETKARRIIEMMDRLRKKEKFYNRADQAK